MNLENDLVVQCELCGHVQLINKDSLDMDSYSYERNMGEEVEYVFSGECRCDHCRNRMNYRISGYEYPVGAYNYQSHEEAGCHFVWEPSVEIEYYDFDLPMYAENEIACKIDYIEGLIDGMLIDPRAAYTMKPDEFEDVVANIFARNGFNVQVTQRSHDGGKDIIATYDMGGIPCVLYIECKKYDKKRPVGVKIAREVFGMLTADRINKAIIVSTSSFSREAREFAGDQNSMIELVDLDDLLRMIHK